MLRGWKPTKKLSTVETVNVVSQVAFQVSQVLVAAMVGAVVALSIFAGSSSLVMWVRYGQVFGAFRDIRSPYLV